MIKVGWVYRKFAGSVAIISGYRSVANFMVNLIARLIAYTYQEKKPSLNVPVEPLTEPWLVEAKP